MAFRQVIYLMATLMLLGSLAGMAEAAGRDSRGFVHSGDSQVWFTGNHNRNRHVVLDLVPSREVVIGKITGLKDGGIYMDGEFFSTSLAPLVDNYTVPVAYEHLYFGLEAHVIYEHGNIIKIVIYDIRRPRAYSVPEEFDRPPSDIDSNGPGSRGRR